MVRVANPILQCPPPASPAPWHCNWFMVMMDPFLGGGVKAGCGPSEPLLPPQVWDEANRRALELVKTKGWVSIHSFDHPLVW